MGDNRQNGYNIFLNCYKGIVKEKNNMIMSTLVANFQTKFGLKNKGVDIITNIINNISEETTCIIERNILIWNLYVLIDEYIEAGQYILSQEYIEKAKRNFTRDVILGDTVGSFHVSWIDQILLKEAKLNIKIGEITRGEEICRQIIGNREEIRRKSIKIGEIIEVDRCKSTSYKYLSKIYSSINESLSIDYLQKAIYYKCKNKDDYISYIRRVNEMEETKNRKKNYAFLVKAYSKEEESSYDNIRYAYCESCFYNNKGKCKMHNINISDKKACRYYEVNMILN